MMSSLPHIVRQLKESSFSMLHHQLGEFFASCDDLFFELASKAYNNQEQHRYFDAMRELRLQQPLILQHFKDDYERAFLLLTLSPADASSEFEDAMQSLALVGKEEAELEVALVTCVEHIQRIAQTDLYELSLRLDSLFPNLHIDINNNPLGPRPLCEQFFNASQLASLDTAMRIILYKQFDRIMSRHLAGLYTFANHFLIKAGVLPDLKHAIVKDSATAMMADRTETSPQQPSDAPSVMLPPVGTRMPPGEDHYYRELSELLGRLRQQAGLPFTLNTTSSGATPFTQSELLNALGHVSLETEAANAPYTIREALDTVFVHAEQSGQPRCLQAGDEDTINIVALFFDYILQDQQIPAPFQALIARLQIPILKVALQDKDLFDNTSHPARLLINLVADLALRWQGAEDYTRDPLYLHIEKIVQAAHAERTPTATFFQQQYAALSEYIDMEAQRIALVEQRTRTAAEGKARVDQATRQLQGILWQRLHDKSLPDFVGLFLLQSWYRVLHFILLRHGLESTYWLKGIQVVDDLVWALQAPSDEKSKARLERLVPKLIVRLHSGLKLLGPTANTALEQLRQTKELLVVIQQGGNPAANRYSFNELVRKVGHHESMQPQKTWRDLTALERQQIKQQAIHHRYLQQVNGLETGTWFVYQDTLRNKSTRCKLASRLDNLDRFLFVNRLGMRVLELDKQQVAMLFEQGELQVLERTQLFDRALDNIVTGLKQLSA